MQKNPNFCNQNHSFIPTLDTRHRHWQTLDPLPYNLNLCAVKPHFIGPQIIGFLIYEKNNEKPNYKEPHVASLAKEQKLALMWAL